MDVLHESDFWKFGIDKIDSLMIYQWYETSESMNEEDYKQEMQKNAEEYERYAPSKSLVDLRNFLFTISPEAQVWTDHEIFPRFLNAGLKKIAFVVSPDLFAQISLEQMMEENNANLGFESRYFDHYFQAREWLVNN